MIKTFKKIFLWILLSAVILLAAVGGFYGVRGYSAFKEALEEAPLEQKVASVQNMASYTALDEMPEIYPKTVIAAEDHRFYSHRGVDALGLIRAIWNNIRLGELREGGSTITQQLAKNLYFSNVRSAERKIAEAFMAQELEKNLEKDEILELYINVIYYGGGQYCLYDAAQFYLDKTPMELTDGECALLAGLPNAPSAYAPHVHPELAEQRRQQVIDKMVRYGVVDEEQAQAIRAEKVIS
ncbi:MAG: transglycosylase domain-containing protein [Clostridia bacterium]|nr:transglycosylase domain-containing protein [Clostridia bacterium]